MEKRNCYNCLYEYYCRQAGKVDICESWRPELGKEKKVKKLFISCPMKGRTEENIRKSMDKMHKMAEIIFNQKLEVIPTYIEDTPPENNHQGVWYLGKSIEMLAEADYFIGIECSGCFKGCEIERFVARDYGIPNTAINHFELMPDAAEIEKKYHEECTKVPVRW